MVLTQHTFMFADLCGFTEYAWRFGDERSADLALSFHELVDRLAHEAGCELVKTIGDAVMVRADDPLDVVRLAQRIHLAVGQLGLPQVRVGLDTGSAAERRGDWFGTTVNTAARVCKQGGAGEIWMTERTSEAIRGILELVLVDCGRHPLKGLPDCLLHAATEAFDRTCAGTAELEPLMRA